HARGGRPAGRGACPGRAGGAPALRRRSAGGRRDRAGRRHRPSLAGRYTSRTEEGARMSDNGTPLISLTGLTKVFTTDEVETHALSGIHQEIQKGEYVAIAGPSGCGKSTLLSILGLLDTPTDGQYVRNHKPVDDLYLSR